MNKEITFFAVVALIALLSQSGFFLEALVTLNQPVALLEDGKNIGTKGSTTFALVNRQGIAFSSSPEFTARNGSKLKVGTSSVELQFVKGDVICSAVLEPIKYSQYKTLEYWVPKDVKIDASFNVSGVKREQKGAVTKLPVKSFKGSNYGTQIIYSDPLDGKGTLTVSSSGFLMGSTNCGELADVAFVKDPTDSNRVKLASLRELMTRRDGYVGCTTKIELITKECENQEKNFFKIITSVSPAGFGTEQYGITPDVSARTLTYKTNRGSVNPFLSVVGDLAFWNAAYEVVEQAPQPHVSSFTIPDNFVNSQTSFTVNVWHDGRTEYELILHAEPSSLVQPSQSIVRVPAGQRVPIVLRFYNPNYQQRECVGVRLTVTAQNTAGGPFTSQKSSSKESSACTQPTPTPTPDCFPPFCGATPTPVITPPPACNYNGIPDAGETRESCPSDYGLGKECFEVLPGGVKDTSGNCVCPEGTKQGFSEKAGKTVCEKEDDFTLLLGLGVVGALIVGLFLFTKKRR